MKAIFRRDFIYCFIFVLHTAMLAGCSPVYTTVHEDVVRTREDLIPPNTPEGQQCLSNCQLQRMQCKQMASMQESSCKMSAQTSAQIPYSSAIANYQNQMQDYRDRRVRCDRCNASGSKNCFNVCGYGYNQEPRQPKLSDFIEDSHCGSRDGCGGNYKACFVSCGGEVKVTPYKEKVAKRVCVKNC